MTSPPPIHAESLTISYVRPGREPLVIVDSWDLTVDHSEVCCVAGRSGSGKTSVLRALAGLLTVPRTDRCPGGEIHSQDWHRAGSATCAAPGSATSTKRHPCCPSSPFWRTSCSHSCQMVAGPSPQHDPAPNSSSNGWTYPTERTIEVPDSPVVNANERRSRARWCPNPPSSSPTNRPRVWTANWPTWSSTYCETKQHAAAPSSPPATTPKSRSPQTRSATWNLPTTKQRPIDGSEDPTVITGRHPAAGSSSTAAPAEPVMAHPMTVS